jgi:EpsI family protein
MHQTKTDPSQDARADWLKAGVVVACTLVTILVCWLVPAPQAGGEVGVRMDLPTNVGSLYGAPEDVSPAELYILPKDTTFARKTYGDAGASRIDRILCSIVLSGAEKRSIHRPERCLPSQGWRIESSQTESIPLESGHTLEVTALLLNKPATLSNGARITRRSYYVYWFVGKDITTAHAYQRILMTNWDLLVHRVNQRWAYVIVSADITKDWNPNGRNADQTLALLKQFIHDSVPSFMESEMPANKTASN